MTIRVYELSPTAKFIRPERHSSHMIDLRDYEETRCTDPCSYNCAEPCAFIEGHDGMHLCVKHDIARHGVQG